LTLDIANTSRQTHKHKHLRGQFVLRIFTVVMTQYQKMFFSKLCSNPDLARLTLFKFLSMSEYLVAVRQENWPSMQEIKI